MLELSVRSFEKFLPNFLNFYHRAEYFMRKYMWPNSCLPSATALITAAQAGSQGRFTLEGVENHAARQSFCYIATTLHPISRILLSRLSPHASRMGKAIGSELDARAHRKRLPYSSRCSRVRGVQAEMGIPFCVCWRWLRKGLYYLPYAHFYSPGE